MNNSSPFGFPPIDPSKMDPKLLMELSQLIQQLPPDQLNKLQQIMHNTMAGFDVRKEMEEFERNLPPGFREKLMALMSQQGGFTAPPAASTVSPINAGSGSASPLSSASSAEMNMKEARLTILRGVAAGNLTPEEADRLLFPE